MSRRGQRRPKVEFAMTGVVTGIAAGSVIGFVVEIGAGGGELTMAAGSFAGLLIGSLCEACRFVWRQRVSRNTDQQSRRALRRRR